MSLKASECRKFAPNIFNRSKCQNCFRGKDAHSPEALESNRATRKVSCCGYLFVAPDWDFSLAANRNKRWQRRWFVLYDDGELAYSVDEHPETVPQSVIDMTRVLEVADAEGVTGNPFALALTCPDKVHFVKGTSRDETKKWFEVLSKFPRNTVCGKYKRNATFPCIKPVLKIETPVVRRDTVDGFSSKPRIQSAFDPGDDLYPTKDTNSSAQEKKKQEIQNESMCLREESKMHSPVYLVMSDVPKKILEQPFRKTVDKWEELKGRTIHKSASVPDTALLREDKPPTHQVRGDPDGCNPDSLPPYSSPPDFPPDDQFLKKGWLVRQLGEGGGWSKHWFVLRNCALAFYADPIAEEAGVMDGVIDLRQVRDVSPHDPPSGSSSFTFCIQMKDSSRLLLSAVSAKIRSHWVRALASTTAPPSPPPARNALSRIKARSRNHPRCCPPDAPTAKEECQDVAAKERLEEASWAIWLDVAKFCRGGAEGEGIARVEERLQAVQAELDKAKGEPTTPANSVAGSLVRCSDGGETVRRLQAQVRAAQAQADCLELWAARARAAAAQAERLHASQMALMAARVEDLTAKLLAAERQVRQLRQRVAKLETRRRSSLKGKEALTLSKEYEAKLSELEGKIEGLLGGAEEEEVSRDSLLARLHALDRRVTDAMPKIRLQVESSEDKWNSLSLSTSMTDLSSPTPPSPEELWEELVSRVASLEAWVRSNLHTDDLPLSSGGPERSLRWLQDAASDLYRQAHFQQYRTRVVVGHLRRLELALEGLELFMEQHPPTLSLCALAARLSRQQEEEECGDEEAELWRRVGERRERVGSLLGAFKGRSLERLCAALRELAEEPPAQATQAHFLQHVVAQVANSFTHHTARSLFPWLGEDGAGAAQGALAQLSLELRELRALPPGGCGVLLEYARCAVGQLARVVAVAAIAEAAAEQLASQDFASTCRSTEGVGLGGVVSLCDPDELGVSHRSVSSLLCFKRKWKDKQHCRSCTELRQEVSYLQGELEESRAVSGALCEQTEALRAQQEMQFNEEKKILEKELQTAKNNLKKIELHYDAEVEKLQQEYETKLQQKNELSRENSKLLFATEMEQLKGVCERGLSALDAAHGKALCELERRHQRELHEMANERQRALADEARATALALEAVRNAHSEELKKQMQSFKEEFVLKMNKKLETEAFKKCYEADLGAMKCEIMSMTEKYSVKCLENATLHEKLEVMNQQLKSTTTQVVDLLARNQQLRARLTSAQIQKQEESVL